MWRGSYRQRGGISEVTSRAGKRPCFEGRKGIPVSRGRLKIVQVCKRPILPRAGAERGEQPVCLEGSLLRVWGR